MYLRIARAQSVTFVTTELGLKRDDVSHEELYTSRGSILYLTSSTNSGFVFPILQLQKM